jgi:uncharacterized damage-inducible protein DinB
MYTKISDFKEDWAYESEATLKVFNNLKDESLKQQVTPEGRTLGFLAWHITTAIGEKLSRVGVKTDSPAENAPVPAAAYEIKAAYENASKTALEEILNSWTDDTLLKEDDMYGQMWKRGRTIGALITHQVHHRGQMTVLMRQAGLKVPGFYGPSKEEWAQFGMPAMP